MIIEYGENCPRCGNKFEIRDIEFQSCYDCKYPYQKEENVIQKQEESKSYLDDDDLPF